MNQRKKKKEKKKRKEREKEGDNTKDIIINSNEKIQSKIKHSLHSYYFSIH
jgi:hypothetical protein